MCILFKKHLFYIKGKISIFRKLITKGCLGLETSSIHSFALRFFFKQQVTSKYITICLSSTILLIQAEERAKYELHRILSSTQVTDVAMQGWFKVVRCTHSSAFKNSSLGRVIHSFILHHLSLRTCSVSGSERYALW